MFERAANYKQTTPANTRSLKLNFVGAFSAAANQHIQRRRYSISTDIRVRPLIVFSFDSFDAVVAWGDLELGRATN